MEQNLLEQRFLKFLHEDFSNLEEVVFSSLSGEQGTIEKPDRRFFDSLVAYSFIKSNLDILEHGLPSIYISNILHGFARHQAPSMGYWVDYLAKEQISHRDNQGSMRSFCRNFIFYRGLYPEVFHHRVSSPEFYRSIAKKNFKMLQTQPGDVYSLLGSHLDRYVGALNFMQQKLLDPKVSPSSN